MGMLKELRADGYERLVAWEDPAARLTAVIAIHSTIRGPALGGCRMWPYPSLDDAVQDALRLSKAMTYKAAVAGLPLGGGKAVILGDPKRDKTPVLLKSLGQFINSLEGRYLGAEDVGLTLEDIDAIRQETKYVTGGSEGSGGSGDPSILTALGVFCGIKVCLKERFGEDSIKDRAIAIQGVGRVGGELARLLHAAGAQLIVSDLDQERADQIARRLDAEAVPEQKVLEVFCDVLSPCALGGVIHSKTATRLKCQIVAGGANNQLAEDHYGDVLAQREILYAPDYVINAGGLISVAREVEGYSKEEAVKRTEAIADTLAEVFELARREGIAPHRAADRLAEERLRQNR
jgi:leucine dehydrogenase